MINAARLASVAVLALVLAGCDNDSPPAEFRIQALHASPDAPPVNISIGDNTISNVDFRQGTAALTLEVESLPVKVDGILPGGNATVIGPVNLNPEPDTLYSVIAIGDVANLDALILEQPDTAVPAGSVRLRLVHAAPDAPQVDVYLTAPGADLALTAPAGTFSFGEDLGPLEVPAGSYQARVTLTGNPAAVVYDSGTLPLAAGSSLLITAVENTATGDAPISLVVLDGSGSAEILDVEMPADLRVVHASPDAPAVDVVVNDDFGNPLVSGLFYPDFTPFVSVPAATYNTKVTDSATQTVVPIDVDLTLLAGMRYTVLAVDNLANIEPLVATDDARRVATYAKVRIIHASPTAQLVDIYVTEPAADINLLAPTLAQVPFKANTGYIPLPEGSYDVTVTPAGSKSAAIGPVTITVDNGGIYTAVARDDIGGSGGTPLGLILMDDFTL